MLRHVSLEDLARTVQERRDLGLLLPDHARPAQVGLVVHGVVASDQLGEMPQDVLDEAVDLVLSVEALDEVEKPSKVARAESLHRSGRPEASRRETHPDRVRPPTPTSLAPIRSNDPLSLGSSVL